jgi:hypothetical protein
MDDQMTTTSQLLIYQTEGSKTRLEIWLEDETMRQQQN